MWLDNMPPMDQEKLTFKEKIGSIIKKVNPFDKKSREIKVMQEVSVKNNTIKLQDALSFDTGWWDMPEQDMVISALDGLYNGWKVSAQEIIEVVGWLPNIAKLNLIKFYNELKVTSKEVKQKSKLWKLFAKVVDIVDDASEKIGLGKYEKDEFDTMIKTALNPEQAKKSNEWKLIASIDDLLKQKDYSKLVDILQWISPINMWNKWLLWSWALAVLTLTSWWLVPILASWFFGARWLRQDKIRKIAKDSNNMALLNWIKAEINVRLNDKNITNWKINRLQEVMNILESH